MGRFARSARGALVNFDEMEIKQALMSAPPPISVDQRRQFINDKDGVSARKAAQLAEASGITSGMASEALALAVQGMQESAEDESE